MENKRGALSHFSTLIRVIILILLAAIIVFFTVQFIRNRQATQRAQQAGRDTTRVAQDQKDEKNETSGSSDEKSSTEESANTPSGIADGEQASGRVRPDVSTGSIPSVGTGSEIIFATLILMGTTYILMRLGATARTLKSQRSQ